jgi:aminomethyltransferase
MLDRAIPRSKMKVLDAESNIIGMVTSGSTLPSLEASGGLALLDKTDLKVGEIVYIDVRGKVKQAKLVKRPFYEAKTKN